MTLIELIVLIVVIGFVLWLVTTIIPMEATIRRVLVAVVALIVVLYVLQAFGLLAVLRLR